MCKVARFSCLVMHCPRHSILLTARHQQRKSAVVSPELSASFSNALDMDQDHELGRRGPLLRSSPSARSACQACRCTVLPNANKVLHPTQAHRAALPSSVSHLPRLDGSISASQNVIYHQSVKFRFANRATSVPLCSSEEVDYCMECMAACQ
jgi:hypothetical protein